MELIEFEIDSGLLREASTLAKRRGVSLSQLLTREIEILVGRETSVYEAAKRSALAHLEKGDNLGWVGPKDRGELYDH